MNKSSLMTVLTGLGLLVSRLAHAESVEVCDPVTVAHAPSGYTCLSGSVLWEIERETFFGKRVYRDGRSGLKVTVAVDVALDPLDFYFSQPSAISYCDFEGYRLPSGYPSDLNGYKAPDLAVVYPDRDSDFETLEKDGIRQVIPGLNHDFWSSSTFNYPYGGFYDDAFVFEVGYFDRASKNSSHWVLCVAGP